MISTSTRIVTSAMTIVHSDRCRSPSNNDVDDVDTSNKLMNILSVALDPA